MLASGFYNMDCMDAMREFPDNFFDLIDEEYYRMASERLEEEMAQIRFDL